jgi:hypothetical protein
MRTTYRPTLESLEKRVTPNVTINNNSTNHTIWVAEVAYHQGYSEPDVVYPYYERSGWYRVAPGRQFVLDGGDGSNVWLRVSADSIYNSPVVPRPLGHYGTPQTYLTNSRAFSISKQVGGSLYDVTLNGHDYGGVSAATAVSRLHCMYSAGFYEFSSGFTYNYGGSIPPVGAIRSVTYSFQFHAGALDSTDLTTSFSVPANTRVMNYATNITSSQGAIALFTKYPDHVQLTGSVYGDGNPFGGAGGLYSGSITITYQYQKPPFNESLV